jgi:hypothetical protein
MSTTTEIKGYKGSYDGKCMNKFLFEEGKTYKFDGKPILCQQGFHFCKDANDIGHYYNPFDKRFVLFEVIAKGDTIHSDKSDPKSCTNEIEIVRIVPKKEYNKIFKNFKFKFDKNGVLRHCTNKQYYWEIKFDKDGKPIWSKDFLGREYKMNENGESTRLN